MLPEKALFDQIRLKPDLLVNICIAGNAEDQYPVASVKGVPLGSRNIAAELGAVECRWGVRDK
ncbi:hypothetical protein UT4_11770 [Ferrigenium sp. UT4]